MEICRGGGVNALWPTTNMKFIITVSNYWTETRLFFNRFVLLWKNGPFFLLDFRSNQFAPCLKLLKRKWFSFRSSFRLAIPSTIWHSFSESIIIQDHDQFRNAINYRSRFFFIAIGVRFVSFSFIICISFFWWGWKRIQVLWGVCLFITLIVYHCTKRSIRPSLIILKKCVLFQFCCFCCRWLCYISWYNGIDKNVTKIEALLTVHFLNKDTVITVVSIEIYSSWFFFVSFEANDAFLCNHLFVKSL